MLKQLLLPFLIAGCLFTTSCHDPSTGGQCREIIEEKYPDAQVQENPKSRRNFIIRLKTGEIRIMDFSDTNPPKIISNHLLFHTRDDNEMFDIKDEPETKGENNVFE